jgi:hypothetical protein
MWTSALNVPAPAGAKVILLLFFQKKKFFLPSLALTNRLHRRANIPPESGVRACVVSSFYLLS